MELDSKPRSLRFITGPVQRVEDWLHANKETYVATQFCWSVINGEQHVTAQCYLIADVEKAIRMQTLAQQGMAAPGGRRT